MESQLICRLYYEGQSKPPMNWGGGVISMIGGVGRNVFIKNGNIRSMTRDSTQKNVKVMYSAFCPVFNQLQKVLMEEADCKIRTCECQMLKDILSFG